MKIIIFSTGLNQYLFNFLLMVLLFFVVSCGSLLPQATPKEIFVLGSQQEKFCDSHADKGIISNISEQASPDFYRTQKIIFRKDSLLGSYQFAQWSEPVTERIGRLLAERFRCEGYQVASQSNAKDPTGMGITFTVLNFFHDTTISPGKFLGIFRVTRTKGSISEEKLFSIEKSVETFDVEGARKAADMVVEELLNGVVGYAAVSH